MNNLRSVALVAAFAIVGIVSSAFGGSWTTTGYAVADWTNPDGRLMPDSGSGSVSDGNIKSYNGCSGGTLSATWNTAKDIRSMHVYTMDNGGGNSAWSWKVNITNVLVLYEGAADYVELDDSAVLHNGAVDDGASGMGKHLTFAGEDDFVLTRVLGIKLLNGEWGCYWAHGCGELVFLGEDSMDESLSSAYLASAGQYSAKVTACAADFPLDVYFCRGTTDGGATVANWDVVGKAGTISSSNEVLEVSGAIDFSYCRFYFLSPRYGDMVWSDELIVNNNPSLTTAVGERSTDSVSVIASIQSPGAASSSCDVYFAYALTGETLPEASLVKAGMSVGEAFTNVVTGLSAGMEYDYKFVARNAQGGETEVSGSFAAKAAGAWQLTAFDSLTDYVFPEHWLPCDGSSGRVILSSSSTAAGSYVGSAVTFTSPKDILRFDIYTYTEGRRCMALDNIQVKYDGADDYVSLPGTSLAYGEDVGQYGIKYSFIPAVADGIKNVVGVRVAITKAQNNGVNIAGVDAIGYPSDYTGEYEWDYNYVDGTNFTRPDDLITDATTSGISANESDGDLTTTSERGKNYSGYVWNFDKPHDITAIGLFSNSSSGPNRNYSLSSIQIKRQGDSDYTSLPGVTFDWFNRGSNIVSCVLRPKNKYIVKGITSLKVSLGDKSCNWVNTQMAEVYAAGRESPPGLLLIVR